MSTLNPEQEVVAQHRRGRAIVLACPGSGKTKTITERTGRLIDEGIPASNILMLTFTNQARDEMRERLTHVHGEKAAKVFVSNFHGLCGLILRKLGKPIGYTDRMTIADTDDQIDLLSQLARKREMEVTRPKMRKLASVVNNVRENLEGEDGLEEYFNRGEISHGEEAVLVEYIKTLNARNQCDFSGMLSETARLIETCEDVRLKLQKKFQWIMVDEYQDTNKAQNTIVELLSGPEDNLLAVGDLDQSIYCWRGANPEAIVAFKSAGRAKTGCAEYKLSTNYRSTPQIIDTASRLIKHAQSRADIDFKARRQDGEPVKCRGWATPDDEAKAVAKTIQSLINKGCPAKEIAVFYRLNDMSRPVEQALAGLQIPSKVVGGGSFYDRAEIKDTIAMLKFVCNPKDSISFSRVANKPARKMSDAVVGLIETYCQANNIDLLTAMSDPSKVLAIVENDTGREMKSLKGDQIDAVRRAFDIFSVNINGRSVAEVANDLLDRTSYEEHLKLKYEEDFEDRKRNINSFVNSIAEYCDKNPDATIGSFLQSISLYTSSDDDAEENGVRLMSLHASKGKEFDVAFIVGVEQKMLPHEKAVKERPEIGLEEERRLLYVGITRARKLCYLTFCTKRQDSFRRSKHAQFNKDRPSQFLLEAGLLSREEYKILSESERENREEDYERRR